MSTDGTQERVSRRTIARGAAWAVPAVAAVGLAPIASASGCVPTLTFDPNSCRCTGVGQNSKDYYVRICNTGKQCPDSDGILYVSIRTNTGQHDKLSPDAIAVPVGQCSVVTHFFSDDSSSKLRLYYGATADLANAVGNPNYVIVDAPNNCNDLPPATRLGSCVQG